MARQMAMSIAALVAALALGAGSAAAQSAPWRLTPDGYGPVRIGMTEAQVAAVLGSQLEGEALDDPNVCVERGAVRGHDGVSFMFEDRRLSRISLFRRNGVTTPRGIGVGATAAQVRRAYPRGLQSEPHQYRGPPARYLTFWIRPGQRGVRFEMDERQRVATIHAGAGSIAYVEGCA